jgi:hypothetical protein
LKGSKLCPECGTENACRSSICINSECKYIFYKTKNPLKDKKEPTGLGKGRKICEKCKAVNGARALQCISCGTGFTIKGTKYPDKSTTIVRDSVEVAVNPDKIKYSEIFKPLESSKKDVDHYGKTHKAWISICGNYKINYGPTFYGISIPDSKPYKLLCKSGANWELADRPYLFAKLGKAVKSYLQRLSTDGDTTQLKRIHPKLEKAINKMKKLTAKRK